MKTDFESAIIIEDSDDDNNDIKKSHSVNVEDEIIISFVVSIVSSCCLFTNSSFRSYFTASLSPFLFLNTVIGAKNIDDSLLLIYQLRKYIYLLYRDKLLIGYTRFYDTVKPGDNNLYNNYLYMLSIFLSTFSSA